MEIATGRRIEICDAYKNVIHFPWTRGDAAADHDGAKEKMTGKGN